MTAIPYENATTGDAARGEITRLLRRMGCERVGFSDEFDTQSLLLAFRHRERDYMLRASAKGWATWWLRENPHGPRSRSTRQQHEAKALAQGAIAVNSILRDWIKGQVTAVECGMMPVEAVFLASMVTNDGRPLIEHMASMPMLPPPKGSSS